MAGWDNSSIETEKGDSWRQRSLIKYLSSQGYTMDGIRNLSFENSRRYP